MRGGRHLPAKPTSTPASKVYGLNKMGESPQKSAKTKRGVLWERKESEVVEKGQFY